MQELSKRFKNQRIYANITQKELAEKTGVSIQTIIKFEKAPISGSIPYRNC